VLPELVMQLAALAVELTEEADLIAEQEQKVEEAEQEPLVEGEPLVFRLVGLDMETVELAEQLEAVEQVEAVDLRGISTEIKQVEEEQEQLVEQVWWVQQVELEGY